MKAKSPSNQPPSKAAPNESQRPLWLLALWLILTTFWAVALFGQELAPNVDRWTLFLIPDQAIMSWFDGPVTGQGMFDRAKVWLVAAAVIAFAGLTGHVLLRKTYLDMRLRPSERLALRITLGFSLQATTLLGIGLFGLHRSNWGLPVTAATQLVFALVVSGWLRLVSPKTAESSDSIGEASSAIQSQTDFGSGVAPRLFAFAFALLIITKATLPPAEYDVREYHLQAPKEWWLSGAIAFLPHNIYANMPMAAEIHSLLAMMIWHGLGSDPQTEAWWWGSISGKVIIASFAIWMAILIGGCVRMLTASLQFPPAIAISAARWTRVAALAFPAIVEVSSLGLIEAAVACFFAAGLLILVCDLPQGPASNLFRREVERTTLVAIAAGGAIACKYPALVLIVPILFTCWAYGLEVRTTERTAPLVVARLLNLKLLSVWFGVLLITGGVWYVKNQILAENPVYPMAANFLGGKTLTAEKINQWNAGHATPALTVQALSQSIGDILWNWRLQGWVILPFALTGMTFLLVFHRSKLLYSLVAALLYAFAVWWLLSHRVDRFLIPALPLVLLLAGIGWSSLAIVCGKRWASIAAGVLLFFNAVYVSGPALGDSRLLVALRYLRVDDLTESSITRLPEHIRWLNQHLGSETSVLIVGDAAVFDIQATVSYSTTFDWSPLAELTASPADQWSSNFASSPYDYLLVHWGEVARLRSTYGFDERINQGLIQNLLEMQILTPIAVETSDNRWQVFRINKPT